MFISQTTYSEDSIYKRQNCNLKLKSSFTNCESDNSGKNHCRNPVQTQETVYCELSRSQRNEASFEAKAKRPTTKNKTKRKKQRKSSSCLRGHRKIVQTRKRKFLLKRLYQKQPIPQDEDQSNYECYRIIFPRPLYCCVSIKTVNNQTLRVLYC